MEFFNTLGKMAIGSRLRRLTDTITEDAAQIYKLYDVDLHPKWFPVFYVLSHSPNTITGIAAEIGHSHPSVSKIVQEMIRKGIVVEKKDKGDKRRTLVALSAKGQAINTKIQLQYKDVGAAIEDLSSNCRNDLWHAIEEWEYLLAEQSLLQRVLLQRKQREAKDIRIVPFERQYKKAFKTLNEEWIATYFEIEEVDRVMLDNPESQILKKGGHIFVALYQDEPVGVCALIQMKDTAGKYELAKMAVRPDMRGKNIGWLLGQAAIEKARECGASYLYLESNTVLKPAITLYKKMGFEKIKGHTSPYKRCNIQMELKL